MSDHERIALSGPDLRVAFPPETLFGCRETAEHFLKPLPRCFVAKRLGTLERPSISCLLRFVAEFPRLMIQSRTPGSPLRRNRGMTNAYQTQFSACLHCGRIHRAQPNCSCKGGAAFNVGGFRHSRRRLRLSYPHLRGPGKVSVLRRAPLYPGTGVDRRNVDPTQGLAYRARRDRYAERLR